MVELELLELTKIEALRLVHLLLCAAATFLLTSIWLRIVRENESYKNEIGLLLLAGAFAMWVFMDAYRFTGLMEPGASSLVIKTFSAYNNAFFLASLPFFTSRLTNWPLIAKAFQPKLKWVLIVLISNIGLVMLYALAWKDENESGALVNMIDLLYSVLTYLLLAWSILETLYSAPTFRRNLFPLACIVFMVLIAIQLLFSPVFKVQHYDVLSILALVSHFLMMVVLLLWGGETLANVRIEASAANHRDVALKDLKMENDNLKQELAQNQASHQNHRDVSILSERELEVLGLIHLSYTEIGERLFISRETVISHKKNIESKLGLSGKRELEDYSRAKGLG
jgi:DNA-binding CsgD family transcriptional regulator